MILGNVCTRGCYFCAVNKGCPSVVSVDEPLQVAEAIAELKLKHAVITSVTRDDLSDGGAAHFALVVREIRRLSPLTTVEILTPDFNGDLSVLNKFENDLPDIFNHNLETVPRLYNIRPKAEYGRSLNLLESFKKRFPSVMTKSGLMVGLGEAPSEIEKVMIDLRNVDCGILSIGQYLSPGLNHAPVIEYVKPEQFDEYAAIAKRLGFKAVFSGPFVRSSYLASYENVT